ncbi:acetoacetate--CoA ligase [Photobacterium sp. OFAV2-7]|uniref:acetoacetate--CoA ligase n=1 Tax=Photobacterium sp. OFAV2-7 TaxID=2917748 RepID=UPI001EF553BC|nr:acetoacetate--CoA ligase [Photobacterium sp. OFAV2-7]MCG7586982.1 acetoacetate--CoA ligase [Photobacterium sp. OFAV2-7]
MTENGDDPTFQVNSTAHPQIMWMPEKDRIHDSLLYQFMVDLSEKKNTLYHDYNQLHHWTIEHSEEFWDMLWDFCDVMGEKNLPITQCPANSQLPAKETQWFPHASLNFAENLLNNWNLHAAADAIVFHCEGVPERRQHLSWQQLYRQTSQVAAFMAENGVKQGDVVAAYIPNIPQAIVAMLATASLGAIWTSTSPDFGVESVVERFGQTKPKLLICADGYFYNGKTHNSLDKVSAMLEKLPSVKQLLLIPYIEDSKTEGDNTIENERGTVSRASGQQPVTTAWWDEMLKQYPACPLSFTQVPFNHPLYILYSSGTTGKPKCIVHNTGGTLLNHLKEHQLHCNLKSGDRLFYFTTCGWMMWNWMVSGLATGASLVIYDGSPFFPDGNVLWDMAEQESVTLFGTSAKYLEALEKQGYQPASNHDLLSLNTLCSTGSVLAPEQFDYVYQAIKSDLQLASISGGTDICGCFAIGNPLNPVYRGECQGRALGMDVQVFDDNGRSLFQQQGELVCCNSFPNQPIGFWNDEDGSRYHKAYWHTFPNTWHHGDFVSLSETGGMTFYGRSDAILNPGGVRIGTAEIYRQVNPLDEITDSVVIGQHWHNDIRVVLFVQLAEECELDDELKATICQRIRQHCSPRHVPAVILAVNDIPRTKSGKLVELAVRNIVHHQPVKNVGALANPQALEQYKNHPELQDEAN